MLPVFETMPYYECYEQNNSYFWQYRQTEDQDQLLFNI